MLYHVDLLAKVFASLNVPVSCITLYSRTAFFVLLCVLLVANCIHGVILFAGVGNLSRAGMAFEVNLSPVLLGVGLLIYI